MAQFYEDAVDIHVKTPDIRLVTVNKVPCFYLFNDEKATSMMNKLAVHLKSRQEQLTPTHDVFIKHHDDYNVAVMSSCTSYYRWNTFHTHYTISIQVIKQGI